MQKVCLQVHVCVLALSVVFVRSAPCLSFSGTSPSPLGFCHFSVIFLPQSSCAVHLFLSAQFLPVCLSDPTASCQDRGKALQGESSSHSVFFFFNTSFFVNVGTYSWPMCLFSCQWYGYVLYLPYGRCVFPLGCLFIVLI